jgi:drug/metabolite transporter (DMT)-like permease
MKISATTLRSDGLLLTTAIIWGFAFVAQRSGMEFIGPFAYNGIRFALGAASLLPLLWLGRRKKSLPAAGAGAKTSTASKLAGAAVAGTVLFLGSSLQQVGLVSTTAGNAGFITSLYVVIVPLIGALMGKPVGPRIWLGALLAVVGLYVLSIGAGFRMAPGDLLVLVGALFWAIHILVINRLASRMEALELAVGQFLTCSVLSLAVAFIFEPHPLAGALPAAVPILYGGLFSIGIAYTLQIVAQKTAHPAHASIILSMEALFAGIGGVILLSEPLGPRLLVGGLLMLAGLVLSQIEPAPPRKAARSGSGSSGSAGSAGSASGSGQ